MRRGVSGEGGKTVSRRARRSEAESAGALRRRRRGGEFSGRGELVGGFVEVPAVLFGSNGEKEFGRYGGVSGEDYNSQHAFRSAGLWRGGGGGERCMSGVVVRAAQPEGRCNCCPTKSVVPGGGGEAGLAYLVSVATVAWRAGTGPLREGRSGLRG